MQCNVLCNVLCNVRCDMILLQCICFSAIVGDGDGDHGYNDDDLGVKEGGQPGAGKRPNCTSREAPCTLQSPLLCICILYSGAKKKIGRKNKDLVVSSRKRSEGVCWKNGQYQ